MKFFLLFVLSTQLFAQESALDNTNPITEEELNTANNYIHEGQAQRILETECANNKFSDLCQNRNSAFRSEDLQTLEQMMPIVSSIFSLVVGNIDLNKKVKTKEGEKPAKESQPDYCGYIAQGVELGSQVMRRIQATKTQENLESAPVQSRQAQSMYALADSHRGLRDTAKIQLAGWGSTAACYVGLATLGSTATDANYWIKMSGAVIMGTYYGYKNKYHNDRKKQLINIARSMPNAGDCNPITNTSCFCAEDTSLASDPVNFQKYCVPKQLTAQAGYEYTPCVTSTGLADPNCNCKVNNSCITHKLGELGLSLGANTGNLQSLLNKLKPFGVGYARANFLSSGNNNLAFAKKALAKAKPLSTKGITLSAEQKKIAKQIANLGVPKSIAAHIASKPKGNVPSYVASVSAPISTKKISRSSNKKASYTSGKSLRKKNKKSNGYSNPFAKRNKKQAMQGGVELMDEYVQRAQRAAEIRKDTSKPLFDIISYRYKVTAWKKFKDSFEEKEASSQK